LTRRRTIFAIGAVLIAALVIVSLTRIPAAKDTAWTEELGYREDELYPLTFHGTGTRGCPEIPIGIGGETFPFLFDTGCGGGFAVTTELADAIEYTTLGRVEELNRDGFHRGWSDRISIGSIDVCGETFADIETTMLDWRMTSSRPYRGLIGLAYFQGRTVTLDYRSKKAAVSPRPIDYDALGPDYAVLPLLASSEAGQRYLPFFQGEYEGAPVCVYLDTGKNYSYVHDPEAPPVGPGLDARDTADISVGGMELTLRRVARADLAQAEGLPYVTAIELNSDQLWEQDLIVTFDLIEGNILFRKR